MQKLRKIRRPSHATVIAYLALFVALGGSAYAFHLGKNSVGSKQLKKNAVVTAKVKNEAITAAKVKKGTLTGAQINLSTLGTVPSATHADIAGSANTANIAAALPPPEAVHFVGAPGEPTVGPGFTAAEKGLGFYKDRQCVVHLLGEVTGPSGGQAFILPAVDLPEPGTFQTVAVGGVVSGNVEIASDGEVRPFASGGGTNNYGFGGVTFRAASC